jgi:hypothetical protein
MLEAMRSGLICWIAPMVLKPIGWQYAILTQFVYGVQLVSILIFIILLNVNSFIVPSPGTIHFLKWKRASLLIGILITSVPSVLVSSAIAQHLFMVQPSFGEVRLVFPA